MFTIRSVLTAALAAAVVCMAVPAAAQKMLNSFMTLSIAAAQQAAQAALARCQKDGFTVAVAVVDRGGQPLVMLRDPLAGAHTPQTAINKAATAVSFRTDTTELAATTQPGKAASGIRQLAQCHRRGRRNGCPCQGLYRGWHRSVGRAGRRSRRRLREGGNRCDQ